MLKIKLFNSQHPLEHQELELSDHRLKDDGCLIGTSPTCGLVLPSIKIKEVHGKLFTERGQYFFQDITGESNTQFNDEIVKTEQSYPLETDDIIRIGEFVLIVDGLPVKKKSQFSKRKDKKNQDNKPANKRTLQNIKSLTRRNSRTQEKTAETSVKSADNSTSQKTAVTQNNSSPIAASKIPVSSQPSVTLSPPLPTIKTPDIAISKQSLTPANSSLEQTPILEGMKWWTKGELTVRCINIIEDTEDVKTFRFMADSPTLFNYKPGQFVTLNLNINGQIVKRSYSISSTPSRPHTLEITVKRVPPPPDVPNAPPGLVSNWLHDHIKVGNEIKLTGPSGKFTCVDNNAVKLLFISAGSGITPMMSMSRWALDTVANRDIVFLHSARTPHDIIYRKELEAMTANHVNFHLALTITRAAIGEPWWGFTGRLNEVLLPAICPDFKERFIYVCGPDGFMKGVKNLAESLGFPMNNYYQESFGGAKKQTPVSSESKNGHSAVVIPTHSITKNGHAPAPKPVYSPVATKSYPVVFSQSQKEVMCDETMSLLDLAEQEMIEVDCSCRSGGCGSCKVKKLEGEIHYDSDPDGLSSDEQNEGYILACIAHPKGRVVIDV
ncbi:FAD-binding oxidoreductase [Crocosphaera sp. UHCC 0190]|uniref:FAD-binding oxidoreductase n=1 Tax=Crocosphaera sp. UHCC 0190 TaxID=3110246 RepID=UPI002B216C7A|nr:FAD-binding oxidoreductase [Crocosphaera sp. UHCC 0190]MEA5511221.1 FAD-binding oxidoreductase [Crocosphaera sp. UHCC 0190]